MPSLSAFFAWYHPGARRDYRCPDGRVLACALIAGAFSLLTGGGLLCVRGRRAGTGSTVALHPRVEDPSITWGAHVVCAKEGLIYDILLPEPVAEADYLERAFANSADLLLAPLEGAGASDFYLRCMGEAVISSPE